MSDRKEFFCRLLLCQLLLINVVHTANLADSGYPMEGANPQRNYQFNRKVLCPTVAGGKTTVLNVAWSWPPAYFPFQWDSIGSEQITLDEDGYIYLTAYINMEGNLQQRIFKIHISGNDSLTTSAVSIPQEQSVYTHVQGGIFYSANDNATFAWNADLSLNARIDNLVDSAGVFSVAPLGSNFLVKSNSGSDTDPIPALTFIKVPDNTIDTSVNTNFVVGYTNPVMVYKNATHEFPVMVSNTSPAIVASQYYNTSLPRESARAMIDGSEIISISQNPITITRISAETGAILEDKPINGELSVQDPSKFFYHNGFSIADISMGDDHGLADLYNGAIILERTPELLKQPIYSTVDNVVVTALYRNMQVEFWALDWGTWDIKMKAAGLSSSSIGLPIFSEDCKMHVVVDQSLYTLEPLPIQNVVPILECIDPDMGLGYFSYENLGQREFTIPSVQDRNFIAAVNDTPIISFQVGHGAKFPLSTQMYLPLVNMTFTWQLENNILAFNPSDSSLFCPTTVNLTIVLRADAPFPVGFNEKVRQTFVSVTGISDSRVTVVTNSKRSITQTSELETELAVSPDPNNVESSPAQVVADFATNQRDAFNQQIATADGAPSNVAVSNVTTKGLTSEIRGISTEPSSTPLSPPLATPMMDTNEPQASPKASTQAVASSANSVFVSVAMGIPFLLFWSLIDNRP